MVAAFGITALNAKGDDLAQPHPETHPDLRNSVEDCTCQSLCLLWKRVANDDEANGEKNISAEGSGDLCPESKVPVVPSRVQKCHGERRASTDDTRASDEPASGYAVYERTNQQTEDHACDQVGEEVERCFDGRSVLNFLEAVGND